MTLNCMAMITTCYTNQHCQVAPGYGALKSTCKQDKFLHTPLVLISSGISELLVVHVPSRNPNVDVDVKGLGSEINPTCQNNEKKHV